jgi:nitrite reductase/ring-hydroxylating ferredoxin subunit/ketosteroid isomerase-like protein
MNDAEWTSVGSVADVSRRKKVVIEVHDRQILVVAHDDRFYAFDNICIHRQRELSKGVILNGKIVCPGHQWAFALDTGWEAVKEECQPTHPVRVVDDIVQVCVAAPSSAELDRTSVKAWVDAWGQEVADVNIVDAQKRFADDVSAFGTHADVVKGLDELVRDQWAEIWPAIEGFRFLSDEMEVTVSTDRRMAVAVVGWSSVGFAADGSRFDRPGRATIVLQRDDPEAPWIGSHTHFSLGRGVSQDTHGSRPVQH